MKKAPILLLTILIVYALTGCKEYTRNQIIGDYKCNTRYTSNFNGPDSTGHWYSSSSDTIIYSVYDTLHIEKGGASDRIRINNVEFSPTDSRLLQFYVVGEKIGGPPIRSITFDNSHNKIQYVYYIYYSKFSSETRTYIGDKIQ
ncbi:MAG: hypothetical protein KA242_07615 [Chitinophagales bacterium]|jgi:hypothetical protein|nr:hypothetical protein [Chitinophagales bacterium]